MFKVPVNNMYTRESYVLKGLFICMKEHQRWLVGFYTNALQCILLDQANLKRWWISNNAKYGLWRNTEQQLHHILTGCSSTPQDGHFT